ncbi:hypothetical protein BBJ28_00005769 [Nothophytophthora sp. Chile5]|nr:hypothetical protein BBJ28_00005769 [Nothophytophthora sp. Chile5]
METVASVAPRRHGCETPLHPSQIVVRCSHCVQVQEASPYDHALCLTNGSCAAFAQVVGVVLLSAVAFYALSVQELPSYMQQTVALLFSVQFAVTALLFVIVRASPSSPLARQANATKAADAIDNSQAAVAIAVTMAPATTYAMTGPALPTPYPTAKTCHECGAVNLTADTRHCGRCNKCVPGYDHHCVYLNTCVGSRNYPLFVGLLSCAILLLVTQQVVTGYAVSRLLLPRPGQGGQSSRAALLCALSLLPFLELFCLVVLASFHLYIRFHGLTTHEWLSQWLEQRDAQRAAAVASSTSDTTAGGHLTPL